MAVCEFCGAELPDNARFCGKCGKTPSVVHSLEVPKESQEPQPQEPKAAQSVANIQDTPPTSRKLKWLAGTSPRWLIIGIVIIIFVASGLGFAAAAVRAHLTGTANSSTTTACANQPGGTCTLQTPTVHSSRTVNLHISGAVNGRLTAARISSCGRAGLPYDVIVQGRVGGTHYDFVFRITAYHGAGTYGVGQIFANFTQQPVSLTATWATTGTQPTTATVSGTTKAGTMNITLTGASNTVHITGSWAC